MLLRHPRTGTELALVITPISHFKNSGDRQKRNGAAGMTQVILLLKNSFISTIPLSVPVLAFSTPIPLRHIPGGRDEHAYAEKDQDQKSALQQSDLRLRIRFRLRSGDVEIGGFILAGVFGHSFLNVSIPTISGEPLSVMPMDFSAGCPQMSRLFL